MDKKLLKHCLFLDIETTGLDPCKHGMISCGAWTINGCSFWADNFLREGAEIDERALVVNGEDEEELLSRSPLSYRSEMQSLNELIKFASDFNCLVIVGKNPRFDYGFLLEIWKRHNMLARDFPFSHRVVNWGDMAIPYLLMQGHIVPEKGFSSDQISELLGIEPESKPHTAINGALHNRTCFLKILEKYGLTIE